LVDRACGFGGDRYGICRLSDAAAEAHDAVDYVQRQSAGCAAKSGRACRLLGRALETGYGTPVDENAAREAYGRACAAGDVWGCFRQAPLTAEVTDQARLYYRACEHGSGPACYDLTLPALPPQRIATHRPPAPRMRERYRGSVRAVLASLSR